jgi:hypothetical protein
LDVLAQFAETLSIKVELAREPSGTLALGNPSQEQHDGRGSLASFGKHGVSQQGVGALALATAVGWEKGMSPE